MLSRRDVLLNMSIAGVGTLIGGGDVVLAAASPSHPSTKVNFPVPAHACDSHTHVFGDPSRFPFATPRGYTPEQASVANSLAVHRALHIERIVFVQPSVYGTDNSCMLDAMKQAGPTARGIAVVNEKTPETEMDRMFAAGVRGIRANVEDSGLTDPEACWAVIQTAIERVKGRMGWHVQIHTRPTVIEALKGRLMASSVPLVIDHFGEAKAALGVEQSGFPALLDLVRGASVYVKLSAPYHLSSEAPEFSDVSPLAKALITANPHQVLWGSDWPHPANIQGPGRTFRDISPLRQIDDGISVNELGVWASDTTVHKMILVDNPAKLFGY
jgi:predicted TIM-barrel fold metal-dependent hydrolase